MKSISFKNKQISYNIYGKGPCMVFLHGFPMDGRIWDDFASKLKLSFQAIVIDLPGFGHSDVINDKHDMSLMAEAVFTIINHEQIKKVVLIGHSMGGYVALEFAKIFSEKLAGIVLLHSHASADDEQGRITRNESIQKITDDKMAFISGFVPGLFDPSFTEDNQQVIDEVYKTCVSQTTLGINAALAGMRDRNSHIQLLTQLYIPVLFVIGKGDSRIPYMKVLSQAALLSHAEIIMLDKVGHMAFIEKQGLILNLVQDFAIRCLKPHQMNLG